MKLKKFITSTVVCALAVISLSGMSVSAAEAPTNEKSFTPLAPAGWNTSTTAQQIYGDAEQEPMLSSTSRAPDGWNDSAAAKLLYIVPYVQGILSELEGSGYKLGIYGPKPVCKYIRGTYSATERYMMICDNDWGQSGWSATERDFDDWNIRQYEWNQSLPGVSSVTIDKCESSTNGGGGWKL